MVILLCLSHSYYAIGRAWLNFFIATKVSGMRNWSSEVFTSYDCGYAGNYFLS